MVGKICHLLVATASELLHIQCCCDKQIAEEEMWGCEHPNVGSEGLSVGIGSLAQPPTSDVGQIKDVLQ